MESGLGAAKMKEESEKMLFRTVTPGTLCRHQIT